MRGPRGHGQKCSVEGCESTVHSRGWCQKHYMRFFRHGDPKHSEIDRHGQHKTSEYQIWCGLIARCENQNNPRFADYGGRGIKVCERWRQSFTAFLADMGQRPSVNHSIDRVDNNRGYEPSNCRWATRKEQQRNRKTTRYATLNGESKSVAEWAESLGLPEHVIRFRLRKGWSHERALSEPVHVNHGKHETASNVEAP